MSFTWDQLVVMWQVIGRLVRGGVPARVVFVDAAFAPSEAGLTGADTADTSLLLSMRRGPRPLLHRRIRDRPDRTGPSSSTSTEPLYQALVDLG